MVKDIPSSIIVDLTEVEEIFTIGDLELPEGVRATLDPERHIAHVTIVAEEVEMAEEVAEGDEATPEVISETGAEESTSEEPGSSDDSESDSE